jgi:hypothetical protein
MNIMCSYNPDLDRVFSGSHTDHGLRCWYDKQSFQGRGYMYPEKFDGIKWTVKGVFCSPACARAYLIEHYPNTSTFLVLFTRMIRALNIESPDVTTCNYTSIDLFNPCATHCVQLDEFRANSKPLVPCECTIEIDDIKDKCCWYDGFPFSHAPIFIPLSKNGDIYKVTGLFCSVYCAHMYMSTKIRLESTMFSLMHCMLIDLGYTLNTTEIILAPYIPYVSINEYGKTQGVDITQFRLHAAECSNYTAPESHRYVNMIWKRASREKNKL